MIRTMDPAPFNAIAAEPDVRPWLGGTGELDLSGLVLNPDNICLLTDNHDGGYMLLKRDQGLYEAHTLSKPSARGRAMYRLMKEGFAFLFGATDAVEICTMVPDGNVQGEGWAEVAGFRAMYRREGFFPLMDERVGGTFLSISYQDWVMKDADNRIWGQKFHEAVEAQGSHTDHGEDVAHDHWAGATLRGCIAGNPVKAVALYNRWACVAGYAQVKLLSVTPPVVDMGHSVVGLNRDGLQVLCARP